MSFDSIVFAVLGTSLENWTLFVACIIVSIIIGKLFDLVIGKHYKKIAEKNPIGPKKFNEVVFRILEKPIWLVFAIIGFVIGLGFLNIPDWVMLLIQETIMVVAILIVTWIIVRAVDFIVKGYLAPMAENAGAKIDEQFLPILGKIIKLVIVIVAIAAIIGSLGYDLTAVIAGLGIGGIAIAFAAQATLADVFAGFNIFTSKEFAVGDNIEFDGQNYKAEQIGMRYSKFRNVDNRLVTIPNSKIAGAKITNITSEPVTRVVLNISVTYRTSVEKIERAKQIIREAIESEHQSAKPPIISFSEFKDWSLNIRAVYYVLDKGFGDIERKSSEEVKDAINMKIKKNFDREKISFAFPTQTIYLAK